MNESQGKTGKIPSETTSVSGGGGVIASLYGCLVSLAHRLQDSAKRSSSSTSQKQPGTGNNTASSSPSSNSSYYSSSATTTPLLLPSNGNSSSGHNIFCPPQSFSFDDINSGNSFRSCSRQPPPSTTTSIIGAIETQPANFINLPTQTSLSLPSSIISTATTAAVCATSSSSLFLPSFSSSFSSTFPTSSSSATIASIATIGAEKASSSHSSSLDTGLIAQNEQTDSNFAQCCSWPNGDKRFNIFKDLPRLVQLEQQTGQTFEHLIVEEPEPVTQLLLTPQVVLRQPPAQLSPCTIQQFPPLSPDQYYHTDQAYLSDDYIAETNREVYAIMSMPGTVPPTPPPMPGSLGSMPVPSWRSHPFPVRESAPSKQQIEKEQYAHLPDKLMNAMSKDKKPFTYTPEGIGERGVLNLNEIRSPRMKRRLMANINDNDNEEEENDEQSWVNQQASQLKALHQQPMAPFVLPPFNSDSNRLHPNSHNRSQSPLPNGGPNNKKEVRFAPSPVMVASDDEELANVLERRKQDVESRSTIVTNDPKPEPNVTLNGFGNNPQHNPTASMPQSPPQSYQQSPPSFKMFDAHQLVNQASDAVNMARQLFPSPTPNLSSTSVLDGNNNFVNNDNNFNNQQPMNDIQSNQNINNNFNVQVQQPPQVFNQYEQQQDNTTTETTAAVNEMINQIENDLSEIRLKEQSRSQQPQLQQPEQPTLPEVIEPSQVQIVNQPNTTYSGIYSSVKAPSMQQQQQPHPQQQQPPPPQQQSQSTFYNSQPVAPAPAAPPPPPPPQHRQVQLQPIQQQPKYQESDILKQVLDDGLQDEIDKFESSLETARSPTPIPTRGTDPGPGPRPMSVHYGYDSNAQNQPFYRQPPPSQGPQGPQSMNKPAPPPVPPKPQRRDGRTSCPPEYQYKLMPEFNTGNPAMQDNNSGGNSFANSFRCISPSIEILKKSQASGYNYNPKPRPFCRLSSESGQQGGFSSSLGDYGSPQPAFSAFRPFGGNQPPPPQQQQQQTSSESNPSERIVPIRFANHRQQSMEEYEGQMAAPSGNSSHSQTLPRKIKINSELGQPKSYDTREDGREFLPSIGMFSQLPPSQPTQNEPTTPTTPNQNNNSAPPAPAFGNVQNLKKMYYGTSQTLPRKIKIKSSVLTSAQQNELAQPKSYDDKESGRAYLPNIGMYSQLPPQQSQQSGQPEYNSSHSNGFVPNANDQYGVNRRPCSLPPPINRHQAPIKPSNPPPPPPTQTIQQQQAQDQFKPRLTPSQIRRLPPSQRPPEPNPSKYTGSHIPSRSFRLLQLITGEDIENQYAENTAVQGQTMSARPQSSAGYLNQSIQPNRPASAMAYNRPNNNNFDQSNQSAARQQAAPPAPPKPQVPVAPSFNNNADYETDF